MKGSRNLIRDGGRRYEIVPYHARETDRSYRSFHHHLGALTFLSRFAGRYRLMSSLRDVAQAYILRGGASTLSDKSLLELLAWELVSGRLLVAEAHEVVEVVRVDPPKSRAESKGVDPEHYVDLAVGGVNLVKELASDDFGVWAEPVVDIFTTGGEMLVDALIENADEWFDFQDDDWWGESMLTAGAAGGLAGLIYASVDDDYGFPGVGYSAIAGGAAGFVASLTTALVGGEDFWPALGMGAVGLVVGGVVAAVAYIAANEGPREIDDYPEEEEYLLPYDGTRMCVQGNHGIISHTGGSEFAFDFGLPAGTPVLAAMGGTVQQVIDCYDNNVSSDPPNSTANRVVVHQDNGKFGFYLHQIQWGARVKAGIPVATGQVLGLAGNVGISMINHVHFFVTESSKPPEPDPDDPDAEVDPDWTPEPEGNAIPIKFKDGSADGDDGVPRSFKRYASDNSNAGISGAYDYGSDGMTREDHKQRVDAGQTEFCDPGSHYVDNPPET